MDEAILVLNAGSSSLKFAVFRAADPPETLLRGQLEGLLTEPRFKARDAASKIVGEKTWPVGQRLGQHRLRANCGPRLHGVDGRGLALAPRTVTNLLDRFDELRALNVADPRRLRPLLAPQKRVVLALDGLQPDVGHEVLWVVRDCLSGHILLARSLLSARQQDLAELLAQAAAAAGVPVVGVVSDGQRSIRRAVATALPGVPHQLCHFHYLREAAKPIYEADRHAKKELKKLVRDVRPLERATEGQGGPVAETVQGYCAADRGALTDDGRPPLQAAGLRLQERLQGIATSLDRVEAEKGGSRPS
jgi:hypothetical protein